MKSLKEIARVLYPETGSHGWNHIQDVLSRAQIMALVAKRVWTAEAEAAVLFHDCGLFPDGPDKPEQRDGHETRSAEIAKRYLAGRFTAAQLKDILAAIREHRGSYKGGYTSYLSDLLSSADRNPPDLRSAILRCKAWNDEHGITGQAGYDRIADHLRHKYGHDGYGKLPWHYMNLYAQQLVAYQNAVDGLTGAMVKEMLELG